MEDLGETMWISEQLSSVFFNFLPWPLKREHRIYFFMNQVLIKSIQIIYKKQTKSKISEYEVKKKILPILNFINDNKLNKFLLAGSQGIGKTTLLRTLYGELETDSGKVKWSENANIGYYAQDHNADFEKDISVLDWMT